jgi:hypothetical protein
MGDIIPFPAKAHANRWSRRLRTLILAACAACALATGLYGAGQDLLTGSRSAEAERR